MLKAQPKHCSHVLKARGIYIRRERYVLRDCDQTMFLFQPSYFRTFFDTAASLLETLTDDSFWISLVGERIFLLVKRYSGNDAILVGIFLSLGRKYMINV